MPGDMNKCFLTGTVGRDGATLRYSQGGAACASFLLIVRKQSAEGKWFSLLVPIEVWGKKAEALASDLEPGTAVMLDGEISKRKRGESWELLITSYDVTPLPVAVTEGM
jgi:single-stranded DNA-binding protein